MLSLPPTVRVFVAVEPFDMRGPFDAIVGFASDSRGGHSRGTHR